MEWLPIASPLRVALYRSLFGAQVVALVGTGILSVAMAIVAFELSPSSSGKILGTVLALKMIAYVTVSLATPTVLAKIAPNLSAKHLMVGLDIARLAMAGALFWVEKPWHVYVLIVGLSSCSAAFKPVFLATLPEVLSDEERYTRALSLTRVAYDLENLLSPTVAAVLLVVMEPRALFLWTAIGFLVSAVLLQRCTLPVAGPAPRAPLRDAWRAFRHTPRLRAALALSVAVAAAGAMVIVNGVGYVRGYLGLDETGLAVAMMSTGAGSMLVALFMPKILKGISDRRVMLGGGAAASAALFLGCLKPQFIGVLMLWFLIGAASALVQTPIGRLIDRSVHPQGRRGAFAVQFAASHAAWFVTYTLAGWLPRGPAATAVFASLGCVAVLGTLTAWGLWRREVVEVDHTHELPPEHPHWHEGESVDGHRHRYIIDQLHPRWPHLQGA